MKVYVIGSLRNPVVSEVAEAIREAGMDAFDDWLAAGEKADDIWQEYEIARGRTYLEAINAPHAVSAFGMDYKHLMSSDAAVLVLPAGKSAHLELGFMVGLGKLRTHIYMPDEPSRYDLMYRFVAGIWTSIPDLVHALATGDSNVLHK